jgi:hypothetical protein
MTDAQYYVLACWANSLDRVRYADMPSVAFVDLCLQNAAWRDMEGKELPSGQIINQRVWREHVDELIAIGAGKVDGRNHLRITMDRDEMLDKLGVPAKWRGEQ